MIKEEITLSWLMGLAFGFTETQVLGAALEFELFTKLSGGKGVTISEAAVLLEVEERPVRALLSCCAALRLLEKHSDGRYYNTPLSEQFLVRDKPDYFGGWATMASERLYPAWMGLGDAIRANRPRTWTDSGHAGFQNIRRIPLESPAANGVIVGSRP